MLNGRHDTRYDGAPAGFEAGEGPIRQDGREGSLTESALQAWSRRVRRIPLLEQEEEIELARRAQRGDEEALWNLVESNQRLIFTIAVKYSRSMGERLTLEDLLQEGSYGLIQAARRFDPDRGCRFSTYATYWIQQAISRAVAEQGRLIRLPACIHDRVTRVHRTAGALRAQLGRTPTTEEVGEVTGLPARKAEQYLLCGAEVDSLDVVVDAREEICLVDELSDDATPDPERQAETRQIREQVMEALAGLTPREQEVLRLRYGLEDDMPQTLRMISERLGLSRERVRQIEKAGLEKLRQDLTLASLN